MVKQRANARSVRIIGGTWRSRKIEFIEQDGLRPTSDRVRETLFNWLQRHVVGARCLDLFSGSGVLGFEALSRGASQVVLVERQTAVCQQLKRTATQLQAEIILQAADAFEWIKTAALLPPYDLIFFDPPYELNAWQDLLPKLIQRQAFQATTLLYLECPKFKFEMLTDVLNENQLETVKQKRIGNLMIGIYRLKT